jgi:hypothetical protein
LPFPACLPRAQPVEFTEGITNRALSGQRALEYDPKNVISIRQMANLSEFLIKLLAQRDAETRGSSPVKQHRVFSSVSFHSSFLSKRGVLRERTRGMNPFATILHALLLSVSRLSGLAAASDYLPQSIRPRDFGVHFSVLRTPEPTFF